MPQLVSHWDDRLDWVRTFGSLTSTEVLRGSHDTDLSIVLGEASSVPTVGDLRKLWKERAQSTANPVVVAVSYKTANGLSMAILGPYEEDEPVRDVPVSLAERLFDDSLRASSPSGLVRDLRARLSTFATGVAAGLRNEGLFASHVLELLPTEQSDWADLTSKGESLRSRRGASLLEELGYDISHVSDGEILLERKDQHRRAAAVVLREGESFDNPLNRLNNSTAVAHGLLLAERENLAWLVVVGGSAMRLYPSDPDTGVGRKGQTQTFVEIDLAYLPDHLLGYVTLLFGPDGLRPGGAVASLLEKSSDFAADLALRLRERIYEGVIPRLARAVGRHMGVDSAPVKDRRDLLGEAYHRAMIILFRLLFVAYAEDRRLLPYGISEGYTRNALKTIAKELVTKTDGSFDANARTLWGDLVQIWTVIDTGDVEGWGVPAYNGGLFTRDAEKNPSGAATYDLDLTNDVIGPALRMLLVDVTSDGVEGPVDFRSLSVREFGTIYEGLLESGLDIATTDLTVNSDDMYVPASSKDSVEVAKGDVYFHSLSGSRKATGSYFTKPFAVEHLLDEALEPALTEHLARVAAMLDAGQNKSAAKALFDFRVADLSMGSAHFLVAAIDRIEARFTRFIAQRPMVEVSDELANLRSIAASQLGKSSDEVGMDDGMLLRRQIARRCIYGVDINEIAVELARLAVWIHTFVPGLPLSFLNHGLVWGNSLTGVGTLTEIQQALDDAEHRENRSSVAQSSLFLPSAIVAFLERAGEHLDQLGALADASIADVGRAALMQAELENDLASLKDLCDLVTAERSTRALPMTTGKGDLRTPNSDKVILTARGSAIAESGTVEELEHAVANHPSLDFARQRARLVRALHLPVSFPEVFRRERPGFDVILGNPPWEKLKIEEDKWWASRIPGLLQVPQAEKNQMLEVHKKAHPEQVELLAQEVATIKAASAMLTAGPYPGIGATDIELAAAFCWRFWSEVRQGGRIGVVLPRTILAGAASALWRQEVLDSGEFSDITVLTNTGRWAFDMEPRYTIGLVTFVKSGRPGGVTLRGPFPNYSEFLNGVRGQNSSVHVSAEQLLQWSESAAIPLVPSTELDIFATMRRHPSLDAEVGSWRFRPYRELDTTKEKRLYDFNLESPADKHTMPVLTGASFNHWDPDFGDPYAYADPSAVTDLLQERRKRQIRLKSSAFYGMSEEWAANERTLPLRSARIAFRDVARATDSRTMICALVPPGVALVHKAPYLVRMSGTPREEALLLGILSSIPFDWFARRFVELSMSFEVLNSLPVPRIDTKRGVTVDASGRILSESTNVDLVGSRIIDVAGILAAKDNHYFEWAKAVGVEVGSVKTPSQHDDLVAELDALVAILYGLSEDQLERIFATFHRGWEYSARLTAVKKHYAAWSAKAAS